MHEKILVFKGGDAFPELNRDDINFRKSPLAISCNPGAKQIVVPIENYGTGGVFEKGRGQGKPK